MDDEFCAYCNYQLEDGYCAMCKQEAECPPTVDNGRLYSRSETWVVVEPYDFTTDYAADAISEIEIRDYLARSDLGRALLDDAARTGNPAFDALARGVTNALKRSTRIQKVTVQTAPWDRALSAVRIGPGVWFSGRKAIVSTLNLIMTLLGGVNPFTVLMMLLPDGLFWSFTNLYVHLEGLNKKVFETVYRLGLRRSKIVDQEAWNAEDWVNAYGRNPATTPEIIAELSAENPQAVQASLSSLEIRKILTRTDEDAWTIAF